MIPEPMPYLLQTHRTRPPPHHPFRKLNCMSSPTHSMSFRLWWWDPLSMFVSTPFLGSSCWGNDGTIQILRRGCVERGSQPIPVCADLCNVVKGSRWMCSWSLAHNTMGAVGVVDSRLWMYLWIAANFDPPIQKPWESWITSMEVIQ